ncbi:MAG TPA: acyltransferase [Burkholderiaceae bacterium]|nr:acyltransferase [Burkholderiaceae bacterium]
MNKPFSIYLDLVRFLAACLVYMYHSNQRLLVNDILPASNYGHSSVIVFFVLSGFVIAYITDTREKQLVTYAASRISRVYSVALPAVFLTIALDAIGRQLHPTLYAYPFDNFLLRSMASLLLLNEVWFVSITSFSNVPYWSICYEMWYYVAYGLFMFLPRRAGLIALAALALVLGPKVVLLAPIWVLGVLLYRWQRLQSLPEWLAWLLFAGSCVGIAAFHQANVTGYVAGLFKEAVGERWHALFTFSKFFLSDYLLGVLVFMNFAGMRVVSKRLGVLLVPLERPIRFLAGYTLSLYLLHQPLFLFWAAVIRGDPSGHAYWWMTTGLVTISVLAIGYVTENRRHLLKSWLEKRLQHLQLFVHRRYALAR